jgi:hypothetical protein
MKFFMLTLAAKRNDDDTFRYSTSILQDGISNRRAWRMDFANEAAFRKHIENALPNRLDVDYLIQEANSRGSCSIDSPLNLTDAEAVRLGWIP